MATIIDALAKLRLRGYVRSSPSPQDDESRPQYVSARRRYKSGRKGRISVYRVVDDHIDNRGRRVKTYANVEGGDLDCDERESFIGIEKKKNIKRGQSVRHKKNRTSQEGDTPKKDEPQVKRPPIKSVSRGRRLERGSTRQAAAKARAQAKTQRSRPDSGISSNAGVVYNRAGKSTTQTFEGSEVFCSGALLVPSKQPASSAEASRSHDTSDPSEVLSSSFRQPLLSQQASARLIFGTSPKGAPRSRSQPDHTKRDLGKAVHTRVKMNGKEQQPAEEQQPKLRMSSEEAPEKEAEGQKPSSELHTNRPSFYQSFPTTGQQLSSQDEGDVGNPFTKPVSHMSTTSRALPGVPAFPNARGGFLDRLQGMNPPDTPPYTPKGANPSPQHKTPKPQYDAA